MKIRIPAIQAAIGQRTYYATVLKLAAIPKMFTFRDWIEFTPEDREQRILNKSRIPDISRYITENEDGYLFSSITASFKCPVRFEPIGSDGLGLLEMDFADANFIINDGQHRCAAIRQALLTNPTLGEESISVLLFPYESKERVQQMFADLNRYVVKTNNATNIIFDHHDLFGRVTSEICDKVPAFQGLVDKENQSLPPRSEKAFTLYSIYDATKELLSRNTSNGTGRYDALVQAGAEYWTAVSDFMPDWLKIRNREIRPIELRQENIATHSVVLRALGSVGAELMRQYPIDWIARLKPLRDVNWSKKNRDWANVCMVANSVVANRQARLATTAYLKQKLGIPVSDSEQHSIAPLIAKIESESRQTPDPAAEVRLDPGVGMSSGRRPKATVHPREVRIGSVRIPVQYANQIPVVVANWILNQGGKVQKIQNFVHETDSGFSKTAQTKRLDNGWYIEVGDSQSMLVKKAKRLLDAFGFEGVLLQVVLENGALL